MLSQNVVIRSALYTGYYFNFTYKNGDLWSSGICYEASKSLWMNPHPFSLNSLPWSHFSTQTIFLTPHFRYFSKVSCSPDTSCLTTFTVHFRRVDLPCLDCHLRSSNLTFLLLIHQDLAQRPTFSLISWGFPQPEWNFSAFPQCLHFRSVHNTSGLTASRCWVSVISPGGKCEFVKAGAVWHTHTHTLSHTHRHVYTCTRTHTHTHTLTHRYTHTLMHTHRDTDTHTLSHTHTHTQSHTHTHTHSHTYSHTHTHSHTYTHTHTLPVPVLHCTAHSWGTWEAT